MVSVLLLPVTLPLSKVLQAGGSTILPHNPASLRNWLHHHNLSRHYDALLALITTRSDPSGHPPSQLSSLPSTSTTPISIPTSNSTHQLTSSPGQMIDVADTLCAMTRSDALDIGMTEREQDVFLKAVDDVVKAKGATVKVSIVAQSLSFGSLLSLNRSRTPLLILLSPDCPKPFTPKTLLLTPFLHLSLNHLRRLTTPTLKGKLAPSSLPHFAAIACDAAFLDFARDYATGTGRQMGWQPAEWTAVKEAGVTVERVRENLHNVKAAVLRIAVEEFEGEICGVAATKENDTEDSIHWSVSDQQHHGRLDHVHTYIPAAPSPARSDITLAVHPPISDVVAHGTPHSSDGTLAEADYSDSDSDDGGMVAVDDADAGFEAPRKRRSSWVSFGKGWSSRNGNGSDRGSSFMSSVTGLSTGSRDRDDKATAGTVTALSGAVSTVSPVRNVTAPSQHISPPHNVTPTNHHQQQQIPYRGPAYFKLGTLILRMGVDYTLPLQVGEHSSTGGGGGNGGVVFSDITHGNGHGSPTMSPITSPQRLTSAAVGGVTSSRFAGVNRNSGARGIMAGTRGAPAWVTGTGDTTSGRVTSLVRKPPGATGGEDEGKLAKYVSQTGLLGSKKGKDKTAGGVFGRVFARKGK
ncbi:hypothetical protein HDU93_008116 [Gonapodya sp. JEL0774]|nr:hypothetical protein HDU93_008116 [Gonapodya sp. JEL0774]